MRRPVLVCVAGCFLSALGLATAIIAGEPLIPKVPRRSLEERLLKPEKERRLDGGNNPLGTPTPTPTPSWLDSHPLRPTPTESPVKLKLQGSPTPSADMLRLLELVRDKALFLATPTPAGTGTANNVSASSPTHSVSPRPSPSAR